MCTVTYIPTSDGFVFTSNRDEHPERETKEPKYYSEEGVDLFYPKDLKAGGTWIGLSQKNRLVCLLNGGFVYHDPQLKFPKSRGVIVKDLLKADVVLDTMESLNLEGFAPFTLLVVDWTVKLQVIQFTWCRQKKHIDILDADLPAIWSSSTLYTDQMKQDREAWFKGFFGTTTQFNAKQILMFHQNENLGCSQTSVKMKRDLVETVSTTQVYRQGKRVGLSYHDYLKNQSLDYGQVFDLTKVSRK